MISLFFCYICKTKHLKNKKMSRLLFLVNCILFFTAEVVHAQETSVQIYDGRTIKVGDIIQAGYLPYSQYNLIKEKQQNYFTNYKTDIVFSELKILEINKTDKSYGSSMKETMLRVQEVSSGKELYVEINQAIEKGEIITRPAERIYPDAKFLSDDLLLALTHRVNKQPVTDNAILFLISLRDKELYKKCQADEFEFNTIKAEYSKQLEDMMNNFDFTSVYYINNQVTIDKYDFSKNGYPINFIEHEHVGFMKYGDYNFTFSNYDNFRFTPVTQEYGKEVTKRRQGRDSFVSNLAYGRFYFKVLDKMTELKKSDIINMERLYRKTLIGADLVGVEVYDFKHCDYNFIGSVR